MKIAEFQWFYPFCLLLTSFQMVYNRTANPKLRSVNPITNSKYAEKQPYNLMPLSVLGCTQAYCTKGSFQSRYNILCVISGYTIIMHEDEITGSKGNPRPKELLWQDWDSGLNKIIILYSKAVESAKSFLPTKHLKNCSFHQWNNFP